jgi:hypothetical protein
MAQGFRPYNERAYGDPRMRLVIDDARTFFHATGARYDLIISEPSNPWVSGVSGLFTREFYSRIKTFLHDDGILVQWMHLYEFNSELMLTIIAALNEHFPGIQIYRVPQGSDIVIVAWRGKQRTMDWAPVAGPGPVREDMSALGVQPEFFGLRNYQLSALTLAPLLRMSKSNSDFIPLVDNGAEKAFFMEDWVDLFAPFVDNCVLYQEVLEPAVCGPALTAIREANAAKPQDTVTCRELLAEFAGAGDTTAWGWLDSTFYYAAYDFAGSPAWTTMEIVNRYRDLVYAGVPPYAAQLRFKLIDFASRGMHPEAAGIVQEMIRSYPLAEASVTVIRTMAIEALRSDDRLLFGKVYDRYVYANADISSVEYQLLSALRDPAMRSPAPRRPLLCRPRAANCSPGG